jgi:hypothetical protein
MKIIGSVELEKAIVYLLDDYIIKIAVKENSDLEVDDIKKIQMAKKSLIKDKNHVVLFVAPKLGSVSREARALSASEEVNLNAAAKAIVTPGLVARIVSSFFLYMNKPPIIHQVFENETDAINWLKKIKIKN